MSVRTEEVEITTSGGETMAGYLARPDDDVKRPAVLVYMEIFGVNDHIQDITRRLAAEGYVAFAPDYFHRTGPGIQLDYTDEGMNEGMGHLMKLEADQMISDARDAVAYLRGRSDVIGDRIGAIGFCIGGHMTYLTACETDIQAAASYYGGGIAAPEGPGGAAATLSRTPRIRGRIECYFGGKDLLIPAEQVEAIRAALAEADIDHDVQVYPDADHGFHCDQRATFDADASADAWKRTLALFADKLGG
jgi:carboxymethylenebutenolidase